MRVIRITIRKILMMAGTFFLLWKYNQSGNTVILSNSGPLSTKIPRRKIEKNPSAETKAFVDEVSKMERPRTKEKFDISKLERHMTLETLELKLHDKLGSLLPHRDNITSDWKLNLVVPCRLDQTEERNIFRSVLEHFVGVDNLPFRNVFNRVSQVSCFFG